MCDVASAVMAVMAVASTAMQVQQQSAAISAQKEQNNAMRQAADNNARMEADAASNAAAQDYLAISTQQDEINQQSAQDTNQRALQAMRERAALRVSAGEAGVQGASVDGAFKDTYMAQGADMATIETNRTNKIRQAQLTKGSVQANAQGRINQGISNQRSTYSNTMDKKAPSMWVSGLQIGSAGVGGYMQGATYSKQLGWS